MCAARRRSDVRRDFGRAGSSAPNRRVDLDELAGVTESGDAQQRRWGHAVGESLPNRVPGTGEILADHVHDESANVLRREPSGLDQPGEVVQALRGLRAGVIPTDDVPVGVVRHLTRDVELVADLVGLPVAGRRGQSGRPFHLVDRLRVQRLTIPRLTVPRSGTST